MVINLRRAYYLLYIIYYTKVCYHQSMSTVVVKRIYILLPVYLVQYCLKKNLNAPLLFSSH